jgi:dsRNA-specific ribonuclease
MLTRTEIGHNLSCSIGNNTNLAKCGHDAGLAKFINPNRSFATSATGVKDIPRRTMASTVEALIGAVFKDSGESLHAVKITVQRLGLLPKENLVAGAETAAIKKRRRRGGKKKPAMDGKGNPLKKIR